MKMENTLSKNISFLFLVIPSIVILLFSACSSDSNTEASIIATNSSVSATMTTTFSATIMSTLAPAATFEPTPLPTLAPKPTITAIPTFTPEPDPFDQSTEAVLITYNAPFGIYESTAFRIDDDQMIAYSFSDIRNPEIFWQSESLGKEVTGMAVTKNQAFVFSDNEMLVWDVTSPQQPTLIARIPITEYVFLDEEDDRIYLVSFMQEQAEVTTVDVSDPLHPMELGRATLPWTSPIYYPSTIAQSRILLVNDDFIEIYDISDPNIAIFTAMISLPTNLNSLIEIKDNLLYVGTSSMMTIFDLTKVDEPVQLGQYDSFQITDMNILEDRAYFLEQVCDAGGCGYSLNVVDISDPMTPKFRGILRFETDTNLQWFDSSQIRGHLAFLETGKYSETGHNFYILDLTEVPD